MSQGNGKARLNTLVRNHMRRWNGWGDPSITMELAEPGRNLLEEVLGKGTPWEDCSRRSLLERVPKSKLSEHALVATDPESRLDHAHGQSLPDWISLRGGTLDRFPDGVAFPADQEEIQELLDFSTYQKATVIPYGGGTSVLGHLTVPDTGRPVLTVSLKRLNRFIHFDPYSLLAGFETGIMGPDLEAHLQSRGFTLGHYPQSFEYSSLGGWLATRSSGQYSTRYGRIDELFMGGTVTGPGGVLTIKPYPASAAGPDLRHLLLGSEGRMGIITEAVLRISPLPERDDIVGLFFPSWDRAVEGIRSLFSEPFPLSIVRLSNALETEVNLALSGQDRSTALLRRLLRVRGIGRGEGCMCLVGFTGTARRVAAARRATESVLKKEKAFFLGKVMGRAWKRTRFRIPYLRNSLWSAGYAVETIETAAPWKSVTELMVALETALSESLVPWNERLLVFSHLSSPYSTGSNVYTTALFRLAPTPEETLERWRRVKEAAAGAIVACGGTISHQHGVGLDHKPWLEGEKGRLGMDITAAAFSSMDPDGRMNTTKLL
ncbi:MAG: FAD-binding oxidoreductase [Syntrophales bacterium]|nr:FAD-binding oxidoreductase [Syntrophales bacterium]MDX9922106.1 FAD-binding oxidoreductase [Syntrophales bacterium]